MRQFNEYVETNKWLKEVMDNLNEEDGMKLEDAFYAFKNYTNGLKDYEIDPIKSPCFYEVDEIKALRVVHILLGIPISRIDLIRLLNTAQWMIETVNRMDVDNSWWMANVSEELRNKYMREVHGWTDKDFEIMKESCKKSLERIKEMIKNKET
jgi:hypothetical protein